MHVLKPSIWRFAFVATLGLIIASVLALGRAEGAGCGEGVQRTGNLMKGTPCNDVIVIPPEVGTLYAGGGDDVIRGSGTGAVIYGQDGDDVIYGGSTPQGEVASSAAFRNLRSRRPTRATATISADCPTPGNDTCYGGLYGDTINGGGGDDKIFGERGNDFLFGGAQNDLVYGGIGDDEVYGELGNDMVAGGYGSDVPIDGGQDDDFARGDPSQDKLIDTGNGPGSPTTDTLSFSTALTPGFADSLGYGLPATNGERGVYVKLNVSPQEAYNRDSRWGGGKDVEITAGNFERIIGSPFSDYIAGSSRDEWIYGGGGADVILGEGGTDVVYGGADGDHLDGGTETNTLIPGNGDDYCVNPAASGCERNPSNDPDGGVILRDSGKAAVGLMTSDDPGVAFAEIYLVGSAGSDEIAIDYSGSETSPTITFTRTGGSTTFDAAQATPGCPTYTATSVTCTPGKRLISVTAAGMASNDIISVGEWDGGGSPVPNFPTFSSVFMTGGEQTDWLYGGQSSEDSLIDGPDFTGAAGDLIHAYGHDDALTNNGGTDSLNGWNGNDLLLSALVCENNNLVGGPDTDNASFARLETGSVEAVIGGKAGRPGGPTCTSGVLDTVAGIEDLEGSGNNDKLRGAAGTNLLIGRAGADTFFGYAGDDWIWAHSADVDTKIDCGESPGDDDKAWRDYPAFATDPPRENCEVDKGQDPVYRDESTGD
jgi:Ca2+-binding RTX toxin-like protein